MAAISIESFLDELQQSDFKDVGDAMGGLTAAIAAVNTEITSMDVGTEGFLALGGKGDRIRNWLKRLWALVKKIATQFGAISYSVSIGFPAGVSVDFEWAGPKEG